MYKKISRWLFAAFVFVILWLPIKSSQIASADQAFPYFNQTPDVVTLMRGYYKDFSALADSVKRVQTYSDVESTVNELLNSTPLLVIPSGGLFGLENSEIFRAILDEYVKRGGTLIVFAQQHGYWYNILPGGEVGGYGWLEDQSCQFASSFIDTNHPILAGQTKNTPNLNVDGYFTTYPSNTTVILRRTANGQPDLISYQYGMGTIIATTIYSDVAKSLNQINLDEKIFIRDLLTWAKKPVTLPEIRRGESINLNVDVINNSALDTASVKLIIYDPDRTTLLSEQTITASIPAGQSTVIPISYTSASTSPLGIYHIDYTLLDNAGNIIQPQTEMDSGRFVVSNPATNPYKSPDFSFAIQSDAEQYFYGSTAIFTIIGWNNTDNDAAITFKYTLAHLGPFGSGENGSQTFSIPAHSSASFNIVAPNIGSQGWLWGSFYNESGGQVGDAKKGIWMVGYPSTSITATTDKTLYARGETVNLTLSLQNKLNTAYITSLNVRVTDPLNASVYTQIFDVSLPANGVSTQGLSFALPSTSKFGFYTVLIDAYDTSGKKIGRDSANFELPYSQILGTANLPSPFTLGTNTITFILNNMGKISILSGTLDISLKDPDGIIVYTGIQPFTLAVRESKTLNVPVAIPPLKFGNYVLTYTQSDETRTGQPFTLTIPNTATIGISFDKLSYRVRETTNLTINLTNAGKFNLDNMALTVSVPDAGYTDTKTININQGQALPLQYAIPIPDTILPGQHDVNITLALPSGSSLIKSFKFTVPESSLTIGSTGATTLTSGDTISIDVVNTGGVDTNFIYKVTLGWNNATVYQNTINDNLISGATKTYSFQIPQQATNGSYFLNAEVLDTKTNRKSYLNKTLTITGVSAGLSVKTDKDIYLYTENITALSQIINQAFVIDNANLHLQIVNKCSYWGEEESYYISTWDGASWVERGVLHYSNTLETQLIDLSAYLPGSSGEYKVRIRQVGVDDARIDYLTLMADGMANTPASAISLTTNNNILDAVSSADLWTAYVLNNEIEIAWTGVPAATNKILIMRAQEGAIDYSSCIERTYWQTDVPITQAANTTINLSHIVNAFYNTGQFYLQGTLTSRTGQVIAQAEYPFNIIYGDIALRFRTDKAIYRPGETVTIAGSIVNLASIEAAGITVDIRDNNWSTIYTNTFNIPTNGAQAFTFTITAGVAGVYQLYGEASQNGGYLASVTDKYEVATPVLTATATAPSVVGRTPFELGIIINNTGKVPSTVQVSATGGTISDTQSITLQSNETKLMQYTQSISSDTTYTLSITGDLNQLLTIPVVYGEGATIALNTQTIYPEGKVAIPVTITNTGQIDETLTVAFSLQPLALTQTKSYYIQKGANTTDTLYFDLPDGNYQLSAVSTQPQASAQANFSVMKENKVDMIMSTGLQTAGFIPVTVNLRNLGYNNIDGSVQLSVNIPSTGQPVWNGEQSITQLTTGNSQLITFNINPSAIQPGNYTLRAELLNNSNQHLAVNNQPLAITGPVLQITELPSYQTFNPGQEAPFTFKVKNTGNQEGAVELSLKAYDLIDSTQKEWLMPNEEKTITFNFLMPTDLEEKDYFAEYELKGNGSGVKGQVKYHLAGINISVNATLDKQNYNVGDTARLTITITQQSALGSQNLFARVNYAGYENQQAFTLNGSQTLTFDIPLAQITGEKLFYGIYFGTGRAIYINSLNLIEANAVINVLTDKQIYNSGETVNLNIITSQSGQLQLTGPNYSETLNIAGATSRAFVLPSVMSSGTYGVAYNFIPAQGSRVDGVATFGVNGLLVRALEVTTDKPKYNTTDTITTKFVFDSNQVFSGILKIWVMDPSGNKTQTNELNINFLNNEQTMVTTISQLSTQKAGIHYLLYGIYDISGLYITSASKAFDVGDGVILGLITDKKDYPTNTEPVNVLAALFGTASGDMTLFINGQSIISTPFSLNGFTDYNTKLTSLTPGVHTIRGVFTSNGLTSSKETRITYGSSLPDLATIINVQLSLINGASIPISITVANQGKTGAPSSTVAFYDGNPETGGNLITMQSIGTIASGSSLTTTISWNILGKSGNHTLYAITDSNKEIIEYDEQNNTATVSITIPDITMSLATDAETYKTNKNIGINTQITNLTASTTYNNIILNTEIKNPFGLTIYTKSDTIALLPASTSTNYITAWNTESNIAGVYTIRQTITAGQTTTTKEKQITIEATTELSGTITADNTIIFKGKDLKASYTITNIGNTEINNQKLQITITDPITKEVLKQVEIPFSLKIKETISGTATISQIDLEPKDYNLNLTAIVDNTTYTIASATITVKLPFQITKGIGTWPRVLVYIEDKENKGQGSGNKTQDKTNKAKEQIANLLTTMNINHVIVINEDDFITQFRTGKHNIYMIIEVRTGQDNHGANGQGSENLGQQYIWKELTEAINNGEGLIYIKMHPDEKPDLRDVLGVKIKGEEKDVKQLILLESPIANASTIDLAEEKAIEITLEKAKQVAYLTAKDHMGHNEKEDQLPAITINNYGLGKAILFAFNPIDNNNPILNQVIINAINYITPDAEKLEPTTYSITPINTRIMNLGEKITLKITELLPEGIKLIDAYNPTSTEPLTWEITLKPNEARDTRYIIQLPDKTGVYDLTSRIEYQQNGAYKNYGDTILTLDIQKGFTKILQDAIDNINKLNLTGEDAEKAEEIKELLNKVINRGLDNKEKLIDNIRDLLKAVEKLNKIEADTTNIRLDIDRALRMVEVKIYY